MALMIQHIFANSRSFAQSDVIYTIIYRAPITVTPGYQVTVRVGASGKGGITGVNGNQANAGTTGHSSGGQGYSQTSYGGGGGGGASSSLVYLTDFLVAGGGAGGGTYYASQTSYSGYVGGSAGYAYAGGGGGAGTVRMAQLVVVPRGPQEAVGPSRRVVRPVGRGMGITQDKEAVRTAAATTPRWAVAVAGSQRPLAAVQTLGRLHRVGTAEVA